MVEGNIQMSWKTIQTGSISKDLMKQHSQNKYKGISSVDPQSKESGLFVNQQIKNRASKFSSIQYCVASCKYFPS